METGKEKEVGRGELAHELLDIPPRTNGIHKSTEVTLPRVSDQELDLDKLEALKSIHLPDDLPSQGEFIQKYGSVTLSTK